MSGPQNKEHFTLGEIAERWGVSHGTVLTLVYRGDLRAINVSTNPRGKGRYIVPTAVLLEFEQSRTTAQPPRPAAKTRRLKVPAGAVIEFFS